MSHQKSHGTRLLCGAAVAVAFVTVAFVTPVAAQTSTVVCLEKCMSRLISGDDNSSFSVGPSKYQAVSDDYNFDDPCEWWGEEACFASEPGGTDPNVLNGSSHRMVNAILLTEQIPFFGGPNTWESMIHGDVAWVEPTEGGSYMSAWGAIGDCHIQVSRHAMRNDSVWRRAAAFVHENRHCDLNDLHGGECAAGPDGCDGSWDDQGAYQWTVAFLAHFAEHAGPSWNAFQRGDAVANANEFLNRNFEEHPGFQIFLTASGQARQWTYTDADIGVHPSFASDGRRGIQRLEIHLAVEQLWAAGPYSPIVAGVRAVRRMIGVDGQLGTSDTVQDGQMTSDPSSILVLDASANGPNQLLTSVGLRWMPTTSYPTSINGRVMAAATTAQVLPDGSLGGSSAVYFNDGNSVVGAGGPCPALCGSGSTALCWCQPSLFCEASVCHMFATLPQMSNANARPGEVLTGVAFEEASGDQRFGAIEVDSALPPIFAFRVGDALGTPAVTECPGTHRAVGLMVASSGTSPMWPFVGPVGLMCAPNADLMAQQGTDFANLTLVHASYELADGTFVPAAQVVGWEIIGHVWPLMEQFIDIVYCPDGEALAGLTGHASGAIDEVDGVYCRPLGEADLEAIPGGAGGTGGASFQQFCGEGMSVGALHRYRLGTWLTGIAPRCDPEP